MISLITWLPLAGALLLALVPSSQAKLARGLAALVALATLVLGVIVLTKLDASSAYFQQKESMSWLPALGISYSLGVDGISIFLILLASLVSLVAIIYSRYVTNRTKLYLQLVLLLETAMIGAFVSLDLILFYTFFELSLVPMYFLISIWGGEKRSKAAAKFFIYTFAGSIFMLVGMITIAYLNFKATQVWTFNIVELQANVANGLIWLNDQAAEKMIFWAFTIAFLIKAPAFPFHTWVPDTYAESPVTGPMLSSVMVKMGTYGLLRFCLPFFPDVLPGAIPLLTALAVIGILYGALLATVQQDIRRMLAYSSISHMGFILLGIFSLNQIGVVGGAFQQINHGITATALFVLVGFLIERRGSSMFSDYGGLKAKMPLLATLFLISMLASVGLPGLNGFVGEFLAMLGAFQSGYTHAFGLSTAFVAFAAFGVVLSAGYLLYMFQRIFYGPITNPLNNNLSDLKRWEVGLVGGLIVLMFWGGLYPSTFTKPTEAAIANTIQMATNEPGSRPTWDDYDDNGYPRPEPAMQARR
ncbi:NADH-quinone oxidoreductase subunit M [soil metagenome]